MNQAARRLGAPLEPMMQRQYELSCGHRSWEKSYAPFPQGTTTRCPEGCFWVGIVREIKPDEG